MDTSLWKDSISLLQGIREQALKIPLRNTRAVIFSDLHMGNGGSRDEFMNNGPHFQKILTDYYFPRDYTLILNGDIEELQKFTWNQILKAWKPLYRVFDQYNKRGRLFKTIGNHDLILQNRCFEYPYDMYESLELTNDDNSILIYHGHQFSEVLQRFETLLRFGLKYIASPLGIKNYSKSLDNRKKYKTEVKAYESSRELGIMSVIGHTHRPLFESLSKKNSLKYQIDALIRSYGTAGKQEKVRIKQKIRSCQEKYMSMKQRPELHISELYSYDGLIPCLFNSGCAIGKRGITCLEINEEEIQLLYWYNQQEDVPDNNSLGDDYHEIPGTSLRKIVLNREKLVYIWDRISLMNWVTQNPVYIE